MDARRLLCRALCAALAAAWAASPAYSQGALAQAAPQAPQAQSPAPQQVPPAAAPPPVAPPAAAPAQTRDPLFRVILNDGTALMSCGEFARVGDKVVFWMPIGPPRGDRYQLVTLSAALVNWDATNQYAASTRYAQYVATRAEGDYAVLTGQVAQAIGEIQLTRDPERRLQIAEQTRRVLASWPVEHYGYRSSDIEDMLALLDGTVSHLRGAAGVKQFDFSLVASIQPPTMPLLPDPSTSQAIDQALLAARYSNVPSERIALLRSAISAIDENRASLSAPWAEATRVVAESRLDTELRAERRYGNLSRAAVERANAAAARADVRGVERAIAAFEAGDRALGRRRKEDVESLLALLQQRLDSARRLRLLRDQWTRKIAELRVYRDQANLLVAQLATLGPRLRDVKSLAGPDPLLLAGLERRFLAISRRLALMRVPQDMTLAHASLQSAADMGAQAMRLREYAVTRASMDVAWNASSAAAASMLMLDQARREIEAAMRPPETR